MAAGQLADTSANVPRRRIDWEDLDIRLAGEARSVAALLKEEPSHPEKITVAAIGRAIHRLALLQQHLGKLPVTAATLAEVIETREDFALRRIRWTVTSYLQERHAPQRWEFIRRAGLERVTHWLTIEKAIQGALQTLQYQEIYRISEESTSSPFQEG